MNAIKDAVSNAASTLKEGVSGVAEGLRNTTKGVLALDLKAAQNGVNDTFNGLTNVSRAALGLLPASLAINVLTGDKLDKFFKSMHNSAEKSVDRIGDGAINLGKGVAHGDPKMALKGAAEGAYGAWGVAGAVTPIGMGTLVATTGAREAAGTPSTGADRT